MVIESKDMRTALHQAAANASKFKYNYVVFSDTSGALRVERQMKATEGQWSGVNFQLVDPFGNIWSKIGFIGRTQQEEFGEAEAHQCTSNMTKEPTP